MKRKKDVSVSLIRDLAAICNSSAQFYLVASNSLILPRINVNVKRENRIFLNKMIRRPCNYINSAVIFFTLLLLPLTGALSNIVNEISSSKSQLKLVHVIFSHKLYAPLESGIKYKFPEELDYQYFLENTSDMTNEAKMEMFNLGVFLRQRYDEFLGGIYYPEVMKMRTSEYFLSMISGLLVNAGLWPPVESQKWNDDLDWQPIPTEYEQIAKDTLFLGTLCPHFRAEEKLMLEDEFIKDEISIHEPLFSYVTKNYGKKINYPSEIALLYSCFETIATEPNATLPAWAESIFPYGEMQNVTLLSYDLLSRSINQKQLNGGSFLRKIIEDSKKIVAANITLSVKNNSRDFKISIYSGEQRNVIGVLQAFNLWSTPHIPENGASIIIELRYDEIDDIYGFEIFYYTGVEDNETIALSLPGCKTFCPVNDFARILDKVLPTNENLLCYAVPPPKEEKIEASAYSFYHQFLYLNIFFIPLVSLF